MKKFVRFKYKLDLDLNKLDLDLDKLDLDLDKLIFYWGNCLIEEGYYFKNTI